MQTVAGTSLRIWTDGVGVIVNTGIGKLASTKQDTETVLLVGLEQGFLDVPKCVPGLERAMHISTVGKCKYIHVNLADAPYDALRDGQGDQICLWIEPAPDVNSLEIHTRSGRVVLWGGEAPTAYISERLRLETLTGDILVEGCKGKRIQCSTNKGDIRFKGCSWERCDVQSLVGTISLEEMSGKRWEISGARGGVACRKIETDYMRVNTKAETLHIQDLRGRELVTDLGRGVFEGKGLSVKRCQLQSSHGDMRAEFVEDMQFFGKTLFGKIEITLNNAYRGFVAKITGGEETRLHGATRTKVRYGKFQKDYEGNCRIACNAKTSHLEIETGGELVQILGKKKR